MPPLTRWFVKTSLVHLIIALLVGMAMALQKLLPMPAELAAMGAVYVHLFVIGWVSQLIFGVAYWMFPKYSRSKPRGSESLGWATYSLLNSGLILRAISEPLVALRPETGLGWLLALAALCQWLAGLTFVLNTWGRVKER